MPKQAAPSCACVKRHSPPCFELNEHHAVPQSWGGQTVPENLITLCMSQHGNAHHGINAVIHIAWDVNKDGTITDAQLLAVLKSYPTYTQMLIMRAVNGVGRKIPHTYTTHLPAHHEED